MKLVSVKPPRPANADGTVNTPNRGGTRQSLGVQVEPGRCLCRR
jgi:hypothetical protein